MENVIKKWKKEYIAFEVFYLNPLAREVYIKRKIIVFSSSMIGIAIGVWFYGVHWIYAILFGGIIYPFAVLVTILVFELFSSWITFRRERFRAMLLSQVSYCPVCHHRLRTGLAKQCPHCFFAWH